MRQVEKVRTGIQGFDEITFGGLPRGRTTLLCGGPGSGKTLIAMEFLVRGAIEWGEPGMFVSFEETAEALVANVGSLGMDLENLVSAKKLAIDHVRIERSEIEETGEYNLDGLFIRLGYAIDRIGAKRVALDTIETLFSALSEQAILRAELRRLFRWLADKGVTSIVTGERGDGTLTRYGLEEYVSDCVVLLDQRVEDRTTTRYLRILKYRGSRHGTNEYPFLIHDRGVSVLPITSVSLEHPAATERISMGIPRLDSMLSGGEGLYRGSMVLISGSAGSGKSSIAAHAANAGCSRGERCLYFAFEESRAQIVRNMRSINLDLEPAVGAGLLRFHAVRPTMFGLEMHLSVMQDEIASFEPKLVVIDPISNMTAVGGISDVRAMLVRLVDFMKSRQITAIFVNLAHGDTSGEYTELSVSSIMDTWLLLKFVEQNNERNRLIYILKSRGMPHSNQVREIIFSRQGVDLTDVYVGPTAIGGGILVGAARQTREALDDALAQARAQRIETFRRDIARRRQTLDARISAIRARFEGEEEQLLGQIAEELRAEELDLGNRREMAGVRQAESAQRNNEAQLEPREDAPGNRGGIE